MAEIHWLNPVDGNFDTASDWSGGVVPGKTDDAFLDAPGTTSYTVSLTGTGIQFVNTLQTASTATLDIIGGALSALDGATNAGTITITQGGLFDAGGSGTGGLFNSGTISAKDGGYIYLNGAVNNSGAIYLSSKRSDIYCGFTTLTGGGIISLSDSSVRGGVLHEIDYLTNVDNTIEGSGAITAFLNFTNDAAGVVDANAKGSLTLDVHNLKITNAGLIEATNGGDCIIKSTVKNTGTLMADGGTLTLEATVKGKGAVELAAGTIVIENAGAAEAVAFTGKSGVLELTQSQTYAGRLSGFSRKGKTTLDLRDIGFVSSTEATFSGTSTSGVLTVTDGTHTANITLKGNYLSTTFVASSDGAGGVDIVDTSAPPLSVHRFAAAMAAMAGHGEAAAGPIHAGAIWGDHQAMLAVPRAVTALP